MTVRIALPNGLGNSSLITPRKFAGVRTDFCYAFILRLGSRVHQLYRFKKLPKPLAWWIIAH